MHRLAAILLISGLSVGTAYAADHPGKGHQGHEGSNNTTINIQVDTHERTVVHEYYGEVISHGRCPPGLAKKNNGCMPPGHAKKWARGRPLPRDVVYYALPPELIVRLHPPEGARYVRVASDILLIAVGSGIVLDAIDDLSGY